MRAITAMVHGGDGLRGDHGTRCRSNRRAPVRWCRMTLTMPTATTTATTCQQTLHHRQQWTAVVAGGGPGHRWTPWAGRPDGPSAGR
jgi:hypothetical protein